MFANYYGKAIGGASNGMADTFFDVSYPGYSNLFDPSGMTVDKRVSNYSDGLDDYAGAYTTDYIPVTAGKYVYCQLAKILSVNIKEDLEVVKSLNRLSFYDASKAFLSCLTTNPCVVPEKAAYVRVSFFEAYGGVPKWEADQFGVFLADDNTAELMPFEYFYSDGQPQSAYLAQEHFRNADAPRAYGKRWVLFGDSITDAYGGHDWQKSTYKKGEYGTIGAEVDVPWTDYFFASRIAREKGMYLDNRAKSGSMICIPMSSTYKDVCGVYQLDRFLAELASGTVDMPEVITVAFGGNSYGNHIGTNADTSDVVEHSYYGATKYFIEKIREKCPASALGFILPAHTIGQTSGQSQDAAVTLAHAAIKQVCEDYNVPYMDLRKNGVLAEYAPDGVHVTASHQGNDAYYHALNGFMTGVLGV